MLNKSLRLNTCKEFVLSSQTVKFLPLLLFGICKYMEDAKRVVVRCLGERLRRKVANKHLSHTTLSLHFAVLVCVCACFSIFKNLFWTHLPIIPIWKKCSFILKPSFNRLFWKCPFCSKSFQGINAEGTTYWRKPLFPLV